MSTPLPDQIGTLIVVVLKGKNLPNKRHIGKQDPYCTLDIGKQRLRTKIVKRGGQHPEWDDEIRFAILDDDEDAPSGATGDQPPPVPSKSPKANWNRDRTMRLSCYADDPREPELIGEVNIKLKDVLTKGETDEWYPLTYKGKYSGEIYLEMTFWSNARPPAKSRPSREGIFEAAAPESQRIASSSTLRPSTATNSSRSRQSSFSTPYKHANDIMPNDNLSASPPEILRPSSSLAKLDLYVAPWEDPNRITTPRPQYNDFGAVQPARRRDSFPPHSDHLKGVHPTHSSMHGLSRLSEASLTQSMSSLSIQSPTSSNPRHSRHSTGASGYPNASQTYHDPYYDQSQPNIFHQPDHPNGSSGFVPIRRTPSPFVPGVQDAYSIPYPSPSPTPSFRPSHRRASFNDLTAPDLRLQANYQQAYSTPPHPSSRDSLSPSPSPSQHHFNRYQQSPNGEQFGSPLSPYPGYGPQEHDPEAVTLVQQHFIPSLNQTYGATAQHDNRYDAPHLVASPPPSISPQSLRVNSPLGAVAPGGRPLPNPQQNQAPHSQSQPTVSYQHAASSGFNIPPPPSLSSLIPPPPPPPTLYQQLQQPLRDGSTSPHRNSYVTQEDGRIGPQNGRQYAPRPSGLPPFPAGLPNRPQSAFEAFGGTLPYSNIPPPPPLPSTTPSPPIQPTQGQPYGGYEPGVQPGYARQSYAPPPPPPQFMNSQYQQW
ncbi:uncharacterized protein EI90DRAFT_3288948 [Cantharellus anzutake]|uniref:uncharacterized protein n=1 Tax=Cantharellus anzutake TaxID=1750568 RepID=UPI0019037BD4|nr:uncharacterized protein EI90DRAFT_3288948 [Cantharellus anzutake]KAF8332771.1 hypothetical protein EI90DRAFT_3288948 [Cantharellus anzutake]